MYEQLVTTQQDANGFVHTDRCDSLLWSGLLGAAGCQYLIKHEGKQPAVDMSQLEALRVMQ